jgi:hypothetical protein
MRKATGTGGATSSARRPYAEPEVMRFGTVGDLTRNDGLPNADVPLGPANSAHCDITNPQCGGGVIS